MSGIQPKVPNLMATVSSRHTVTSTTTKIILPSDLLIHLMKMKDNFHLGDDRRVPTSTPKNMAQILKWDILDHRVRTWRDLDQRHLVVVGRLACPLCWT